MSDIPQRDLAPGDEPISEHVGENIENYAIGLALAAALTAVAFFLVNTGLVWRPSIPVALAVLAVGQMGVHLVFFLHITSGPDNTNNVLALAFGVLIVALIIIGSLYIMAHMNENMMTSARMEMQQ